MTARRSFAAQAPTLALLLSLATPLDAKTRADCEREYTPQRAQDGKDVIWVPTEDPMVVRMLEMAKVTAADTVYDLGAGDGKIPIAAAKRFGARAVGIEYDEGLAKHAQCLVEAEGVSELVEIVQGDIFEADFSDATVVTLYLLPELNLRLRPTLLDMPAGTRVVSYSFTMRDWQPDEFIDTDDGSAYLWVVPAKIGGAWTFRSTTDDDTFDVTIDQAFQNLRGGTSSGPVRGKIDGERIELSFERGGTAANFTGTVVGNRIHGTVTQQGAAKEYVASRR